MMANPNMRLVHLDWGDKTPSLHLALDQERLRLIGLTPKEAGQQLQSYLNGTPGDPGPREPALGGRAPAQPRPGAPLARRHRRPDA